MTVTSENVLHRHENILVTEDKVIAEDRTYNTSDIDAVALDPPILRRSYGIALLALGIVITIAGYLVWQGLLLTPLIGGIALIIAGIVLMVTVRTRYTIRMKHKDGQTAMLHLSDPTQAEHTANAIDTALSRSR